MKSKTRRSQPLHFTADRDGSDHSPAAGRAHAADGAHGQTSGGAAVDAAAEKRTLARIKALPGMLL